MNNTKVKNQKRVEAAVRGWASRRKAQAEKAAQLIVSKEEPSINLDKNSAFIKTVFPDSSLAQIYSTGLEYAFVNAEGVQCCPYVLCKDFLQDAIWAQLNNKPVDVYGFSYTPGKNPVLDMEKTRLAVRFSKKQEFEKLCEQSVKFLNLLEDEFGMSKSKLFFGGKSKDEDIWIFEGDKKWMYAPPLISMYTLFIRVGLNFEGGDWKKQLEKSNLLGANDSRYLNNSRSMILKLCGKDIMTLFAKELGENYPVDCDVSSMHNYSGIESLGLEKISSKVSKNWQVKAI